MPPHPDAVLRRLTDRLAPLERDLHRAFWTAATDARPETSAARQRAEEAWLAALGDPELFAEVQAALAAGGEPDPAHPPGPRAGQPGPAGQPDPRGRPGRAGGPPGQGGACLLDRARPGRRPGAGQQRAGAGAGRLRRPGRAACRLGGRQAGRGRRRRGRARPGRAAQPGGPRARLPRLVRLRPGRRRHRRGLAGADPGGGRVGHPGAVPGRQGRARRPPERPLRGRRRRACGPGTTATCSSSATTARPAPTWARCWRAPTPSGSPSPPTTAWASRPATCWSGPTCTPAPARTSMPSAWTSTGPATSGCWPTWPPARSGWTCCCTRSATPSTTTTSTARCPGCSAARPSRWSPRRWP